MSTLLDSMMERLNRTIDHHNARVQAAVESEDLTEDEASGWRLPPGCITVEVVKDPSRWRGKALHKAIGNVFRRESPDEILRMCDACGVQTDVIRKLRRGVLRTVGMKPGPLKGLPVSVRLLDLAHLVAHCGAGNAVLLG